MTSTQLGMLQGGLATNLTLQNNQIVAGSNTVAAVNGTALVGHATYQDPDYRLVSTGATNAAISVSGTLAGVAGTLTGVGSGGPPSTSITYTFTPASNPGTVAISASSAFSIAKDVAGTVSVIWAGRNNFTNPAEVLSDLAAIVAYLPDSKFVILTVMNGDFVGETEGLTNWTTITKLNASILATWPNNAIDIRTLLVSQGAPGAAYADATAYAEDLVPSALRGDQIHLNTQGNAIVAGAVKTFILAQGW